MPSVLITGANRSLELAFTKAHLARGWTVRATDRGIADGPLDALHGKHADQLRLYCLELDNFASIDAFGKSSRGVAIDVFISNAALTGDE